MAKFDPLKPVKDRLEKVQLLMQNIGDLKDVREQEMVALTELRKTQMLIIDDILTTREASTKYRGNEYQTYSAAITEIDKKYNNKADWGCVQTGNIIDVRAAMIIGEGLKLVRKKEDSEREMAFAKQFLEHNKLDGEAAQHFATEAELEGKILIKLAMDKFDNSLPLIQEGDKKFNLEGMVSTRFIPWISRKYTVKHAEEDPTDFTEVTWRPRSGKVEKLERHEFVYGKFGGRLSKPNEAIPRIMSVLTNVESLDKGLRDWREKDRLFAFPTPHFSTDTQEQAQEIMAEIEKNPNFKIKKMFAHTGEFGFAEPSMSGMTSLEQEIIMHAKVISGRTGVPIHYLGLPDVLANRSVADTLVGFVYYSTVKDRMIWAATYEEALGKAMLMYNKAFLQQKSGALDPTKIGIMIPFTSEDEWLHFEKVILPAWMGGKVSDELALSMLPGVNVEEEMARKAQMEGSELEDLSNKLAIAEAELEMKNQVEPTDEEI